MVGAACQLSGAVGVVGDWFLWDEPVEDATGYQLGVAGDRGDDLTSDNLSGNSISGGLGVELGDDLDQYRQCLVGDPAVRGRLTIRLWLVIHDALVRMFWSGVLWSVVGMRVVCLSGCGGCDLLGKGGTGDPV